jgi:hypothetical protein
VESISEISAQIMSHTFMVYKGYPSAVAVVEACPTLLLIVKTMDSPSPMFLNIHNFYRIV